MSKTYRITIDVIDKEKDEGRDIYRNVSEETLTNEQSAGSLVADMMDTLLDDEVKF
jgi:hypothetical protein